MCYVQRKVLLQGSNGKSGQGLWGRDGMGICITCCWIDFLCGVVVKKSLCKGCCSDFLLVVSPFGWIVVQLAGVLVFLFGL